MGVAQNRKAADIATVTGTRAELVHIRELPSLTLKKGLKSSTLVAGALFPPYQERNTRGFFYAREACGGNLCMYGHAYSKSKDRPGKVANPARGQLNRENEYFPVPVRA